MTKILSPSGQKNIVLKKNEHLKLHLEDLEEGSREFELEVLLEGSDAIAHIRGIARGTGQDEKKWKIKIVLNGENQKATLELRGVADDASLIAFDGSGIVGRDSENGDISISEKIVLFSERARGKALPVLRVETENVSAASHAATIAPFDEEMFFYLESRGIRPDDGKNLLLKGFLQLD